MRLATFSLPPDPSPRLGVVRDDRLIDVRAALAGDWPDAPGTLLQLLDEGPDAWARLRDRIGRIPGTAGHPLAAVRWHAPIPRPRKNVFCLGLNYLAHTHESAKARGREVKVPTVPVIFTKAPTTVNGPFDPVPLDRTVTQQFDWEVELGVIVGLAGRDIPRAGALRHVFGYTALIDLSARDLQLQHVQWFKGKSLDGSCPMGPVVVTADEFGDPQTKRLSLRVNGVVKQDASTADMIFPIDVILEWLSQGLTLEPGDVIATGTPEGVGLGRTPPEFLQPGDVVEAEVEGVGTLRSTIVER